MKEEKKPIHTLLLTTILIKDNASGYLNSLTEEAFAQNPLHEKLKSHIEKLNTPDTNKNFQKQAHKHTPYTFLAPNHCACFVILGV